MQGLGACCFSLLTVEFVVSYRVARWTQLEALRLLLPVHKQTVSTVIDHSDVFSEQM